MKVVTVKTLEGKIRYYLNDDEGNPIQPVMKYLRFKDNSGYASRGLRSILAHSTFSMTVDLYVDVMEETMSEEMKKVEAAL